MRIPSRYLGDLLFSANLNFETYTPGSECYYFQPGSNTQQIDITVEADVTETIPDTLLTQFSVVLDSIEPVRCEPISDYVVPQATVRLTLNTTFAVVSGSEVSRVTSSIPYVSTPEFPLVPDTSSGAAYVCEDTVTGDGTFRQCQHFFKTNKCEKIYSTTSGDCGFEHNASRTIDNLVFQETYDAGLFVVRRAPSIDTTLQTTLFDGALCAAKNAAPTIDVTDEFPSSAVIRNYWDGAAVDFETNTTCLTFNDKMIVRMQVGEEASVALGNIELFIKTVLVTLRNPEDDEVITQYSFNVNEM